MSPSEIADIFENRMTTKANVLMRMNSYFRHARWEVRRNAISEQTVATCNPTGVVTVGFGRSKIHADVQGDTVVLQTSVADGGPTEASVGPGMFTTWLGLYMYPATAYSYDVVKAIKRADRDAVITYPWSNFRIAALAIIMVGVVASMVGAGGGNGSTQSLGSNDASSDVRPPPPSAPAPVDSNTRTADDDPSDSSPTGSFTSADGYIVTPPDGWIRDSDSKDKGTFTESRWHLAGEPNTYVLVDHTAGYEGTAEDGAVAVRASAQRADDYEEVGWRELAPSGWYWEFQISGQHKIDVFTKACGDGYAALGATPVGQFAAHRDTIIEFIESLTPPCGDTTPSITAGSVPTDQADDASTDTTPGIETSPDSQTTPATTPKPAVSPEAARNSPTRVLRRHFQRLNTGDYDDAFQLFSSGYRTRNPSWMRQPTAAKPVLNVVDIGPSRINGETASVSITFYARDRNPTSTSDTKCRRFSGQAKMVKEAGQGWRYDPTDYRFQQTVVDSSSPPCNP